MTSEEAVSLLMNISAYDIDNKRGMQKQEALEMAIKALEQQPCEDCISRAEALKAIEKEKQGWEGTERYAIDECHTRIAELPQMSSSENPNKWIPVSERLPEENGFYLATCNGEICGENEPFTGLAEYENGKWVDDEEDYQCVLAWMPLPEPYKAESEE